MAPYPAILIHILPVSAAQSSGIILFCVLWAQTVAARELIAVFQCSPEGSLPFVWA